MAKSAVVINAQNSYTSTKSPVLFFFFLLIIWESHIMCPDHTQLSVFPCPTRFPYKHHPHPAPPPTKAKSILNSPYVHQSMIKQLVSSPLKGGGWVLLPLHPPQKPSGEESLWLEQDRASSPSHMSLVLKASNRWWHFFLQNGPHQMYNMLTRYILLRCVMPI